MGRSALTFGLLLSCFSVSGIGQIRQVLNSDSPSFLNAIGRLDVPSTRMENGRRKHFEEACSATLLTAANADRADIILTAWHCLDYYSDLSREIRFSLTGLDGSRIETTARHLASGGSMRADWALLRLKTPLPLEAVTAAYLIATLPLQTGVDLLMGGFSADNGLGAGGNHLTYDDRCRLTGNDGADLLTDCLAHRGASGGGVFLNNELIGVISRGDGEGRTIFVPLSRFRGKASLYLD